MRRTALAVFSVLVLWSLPGAAQPPACATNYLGNGDLDADDSVWTSFFAELFFGWNSGFDSDNNVCSGSLGALLTTPVPLSTLGGQCVSGIVDSSLYDAGGQVLVALGEPPGGFAGIRLDWFDEIGCTGANLGSLSFGTIPPPNNVWVQLSATAIAPPAGVASVGFALLMIQTMPGAPTFGALFDDLYFAPTGYCGDLFEDAFETESTVCWSSAVP